MQTEARKPYPSDLTDEQWEVIEVLIPPAKSGKQGGRRRSVNMREVVNALLYLSRSGCQWDMLPHDLPPKSTVYEYFAAWRDDGTWEHILAVLRGAYRQLHATSEEPTPSAASIDSQTVKTTELGGVQGYDGGKTIKGRKRHIVVGSLGLLLAVAVTSAAVDDAAAAPAVLQQQAQRQFPRPQVVWADGRYSHAQLNDWKKRRRSLGWRLEIARRPREAQGLVLLPKRRVAEQGETTWGGLAAEVRYWGNWVLKKVKAEIGDLYPLIPDPAYVGDKVSGGTGRRPVQANLFTTRRNLPHWEMGGSTYFITYRCAPGRTLAEPDRDIVLDNWEHWHGKRYLLHCAVVMPDHVHVLITPLKNGPETWHSLEEILHTNKGFTAQQINKRNKKRGSVWQDERYDRVIRDEEEFLEKWNYMANNPVKAGLVSDPLEYRWFHQNPRAWEEQRTGQRPVPPNQSQEEHAGGTGGSPVPDEVPPGYLQPVAYLWTRTVTCKNPTCKAIVPLVRQTWLCRKKGRYVALKMVAQPIQAVPPIQQRVRFEVVESATEQGLGFDPAGFSKAGNATCPFCGTVADAGYTRAQGVARNVGFQLMAIVCRDGRGLATRFLGPDALPVDSLLADGAVRRHIEELEKRSGLTAPQEPISSRRPSPNARGLSALTRHGLMRFSELYHPRQLLSLMTQCEAVRSATVEMKSCHLDEKRSRAVASYLGIVVDRTADRGNSLCRWDPGRMLTQSAFGRPAAAFVWDFAEANPFGGASGDIKEAIDWVARVMEQLGVIERAAEVERGSAVGLAHGDATCDAVVTDPPYYDNVPYADVSDFFYVWLKPSIGHLYPEHFSSELTPKKNEATALSSRYQGDMDAASRAYEKMMLDSLVQANRILKRGGQLVVVYAHKTTLGWATLVDALRRAGFTVTEAWPLDTERKSRLIAMESAALASSIFLVGRKRDGSAGVGNYEDDVQRELAQIVRERVETLWEMGITGADLVIACVGAGLRAFTRFARVEYANGEEVPAERFLTEVEGVVLDSILRRLSREVGGNGGRTSLAGVDPATRFYVLWRYTYRSAELAAGEAIIFANGTHVELDGPAGLSSGARALVAKKKGKYRLRDYTERGEDDKLGLPDENGKPAPVIDALHRTLWLMERRPAQLGKFPQVAQAVQPVQLDQMRLVAQALAGPALKGGELADVSPSAELSALGKLTANWRSVVEDNIFTAEEQADRKRGQKRLFE